jgi:hypothetical protein
MISVIGACEQWGAKIAVDAIREVCPACVPETGLGLLGDEDEDPISHARCRTAKSAGTRCAAICASKRLLPHCTEVVSSFLTKRSMSRFPLTSKLSKKNAQRDSN